MLDQDIYEKKENGQEVIKEGNYKFGLIIIQILLYYFSIFFFSQQLKMKINLNLYKLILIFLCLEPSLLQWHSSLWSESIFLSMLIIIFSLILHNSKKDGEKLQGIRLKVKGNGEKYHIFIQTTIFYRLPTGYQIASFDTSPEWETVEIPFNSFKNLKDNKNSNIDAKDIKTFGIVAYGRDFKSDLSVSSLEFYY